MFQILAERLRQQHRTTKYPAAPAQMPDRFRGLPLLDASKCSHGCRECVAACPTQAIEYVERDEREEPGQGQEHRLRLDLGRCLFCTDCVEACPEGAIEYTTDYRLAARTRDALVLDGGAFQRAAALDEKLRKLFRRSLKLRQVSAAGCNGCEADVNVLNTIGFDLGRFGISFVASPRHADGLLITGPVSVNMKLALEKCYAAVPAPKVVIAVGACAIAGGPYIGHAEVCNGADGIVPVDLYIPGCPPHPLTILDGLLRLLGRLEDEGRYPAAPSAAGK